MPRKLSTMERRARRDVKQRSLARNMNAQRNTDASQVSKDFDAEGGGGFNPRIMQAESTGPSGPEERPLAAGNVRSVKIKTAAAKPNTSQSAWLVGRGVSFSCECIVVLWPCFQ